MCVFHAKSRYLGKSRSKPSSISVEASREADPMCLKSWPPSTLHPDSIRIARLPVCAACGQPNSGSARPRRAALNSQRTCVYSTAGQLSEYKKEGKRSRGRFNWRLLSLCRDGERAARRTRGEAEHTQKRMHGNNWCDFTF